MSMSLSKGLIQNIQRLLAFAGVYKKTIDGIYGTGPGSSDDGVRRILASTGLLEASITKLTPNRRAIWAAQAILRNAGHYSGTLDGYWGNQSEGAFLEWNHIQTYGKPLVLPREVQREGPDSFFPAQKGFQAFYGEPGSPALKNQLIEIDLPYKMRIDWNLHQTKSKMTLHQKCAESAVAAFEDILRAYGIQKIRSLGLDRYAGSYNHRRMRGGTAWSTHAYGAAIDHYAAPNGLTTRCPQALFCSKSYTEFFDIWEAHGWTSLGRAIGRDWMHVQAGRVS